MEKSSRSGTRNGVVSSWLLLVGILALGIGGWSLRYALPHPRDVPNFESFRKTHGFFIVHALSASIALILGPVQFLGVVRRALPRWHRWIGRVYVGAVTTGWIGSAVIAEHAHTGMVASAAFYSLGAAWLGATAMGLYFARMTQPELHREWMLRSYALTAAGITLRLYLVISGIAELPFDAAYSVIAWLCWVPNVIGAELYIRKSRDGTSEIQKALRDVGLPPPRAHL